MLQSVWQMLSFSHRISNGPITAHKVSSLPLDCPEKLTESKVHTPSLTNSSKVVIIGSGCFGISTALHLLQRGYKNVIVLDRAPTLPAVDAASTDLNKIVRSSYDDPFYAGFAREAIAAWKNRDEWGDLYHECGVLVFGVGEATYAGDAYRNDIAQGARVKKLLASKADPPMTAGVPEDAITLSELFRDIPLGPSMEEAQGYLNADGGWTYAEGGVLRAIRKVEELGGKVLAGKEVLALLRTSERRVDTVTVNCWIPDRSPSRSRTRGVLCNDGSEYLADIVIIATGSWTASAFPELNLDEKCLAAGQSVATVELTEEEASRYRDSPVVLDFGTGFYIFPPNGDNVVKFAKHVGGITNFQPISSKIPIDLGETGGNTRKISQPRTYSSHGPDGLKIPLSESQYLRNCLRQVYPELAQKPFATTRLCWYTDSPDSDWIIDLHPDDAGLAFATSGSGHAYKFLPVLGRLVVDRLEGKLNLDLQRKFAFNRDWTKMDRSRAVSGRRLLDVNELRGPAELKEQASCV